MVQYAEASVCYWSVNISNDSVYMRDREKDKSTSGWGFKCLPQRLVGKITISHIDNLRNIDTAGERIGSSPSNSNYRHLALVEGARSTYAQQDQLSGIGQRALAGSSQTVRVKLGGPTAGR